MALPDFIPDSEIGQYEQSSAPDFISDAEMDRLLGGTSSPTLFGEAVRGIKEAPQSAWQLASGIGDFASHPIQSVEDAGLIGTARTGGRLASGAAGAIAGSEAGGLLGSFLGPVGTVVGGVGGAAIGGGLGLLGFNKVDEAIENKDASRLMPTRQDFLDTAYNTGQGLAFGAAGKTIQGAVKGTRGLLRGGADLADDFADSAARDVLAVKNRNIEQSAKRGVQFLDDAGNPVAPEDAVSFTSRLDRQVSGIRNSSLWDKLGNDPKQNFLAVSSELDELNKTKGALVSEVDDSLKSLGSQYGIKIKVKPDWSIAEDYIESGRGTAGNKSGLARQLQRIKADWAAKDGTFEDLIKFKSEVDTGKLFPTGPSDAANVKLRESILLGVKKAAEETADSVLGKPGTFKAVNGKIADLLSIRDLLATKAATAPTAIARGLEGVSNLKRLAIAAGSAAAGAPGLAGSFLAGEAFTGAFPKTASRLFGAGSSVFNALDKGASVFSPIGKVAGSPATVGAILGAGENRSKTTSLQEQQGSSSSSPVPQTEAPALPELSSKLSPSSNSVPNPAKTQVFDALLDAIKKVESGGNRKAVSHKGAQGPYQLMPATGREYHDKLGIKDPYDPFDEEQAREIAAAIIQDNLEALDGDLKKAVTAFHSGQGNVKKGNLGPEGRAYYPKVASAFDAILGRA